MFHFSTAIFFCQGQFPADLAEYCYDVVLQIAYKLCAYEEIFCVKHLIFEKMCAIIIEIHKLRTSEAAVRLHIAYYVSNK